MAAEDPIVEALRTAGAAWRTARNELEEARAACVALIGPATAAGIAANAIQEATGLSRGTVTSHAGTPRPPGERHSVFTKTRGAPFATPPLPPTVLERPVIVFAGAPSAAERRQAMRLALAMDAAGEVYEAKEQADAVAREHLRAAIRATEGTIPMRRIATEAGVNNNLRYWLEANPKRRQPRKHGRVLASGR